MLELELGDDRQVVWLVISPPETENLAPELIKQIFRDSAFNHYHLLEGKLIEICSGIKKRSIKEKERIESAGKASEPETDTEVTSGNDVSDGSEDTQSQPLNDRPPEIAPQAKDIQTSDSTPRVSIDDVQKFIIAEARDAELSVEISEDQMQAKVHYRPAQGGKNLDQKSVVSVLRKNKVLKGIHQKALALLLTNPTEEKTLIIADGKEPESGEETRFEYLVTTIQHRELVPQKREDGTFDMRELGDIETVEEHQPLLRKIPSKPGVNGYTVSGEVIFSKAPDDIALIMRDGTMISPEDPNLIIASRRGVPVEHNNGIQVDDILMIDQDLDLSIGNIDYEGSVVVKGDVKEAMSLKATGDIIITGFVEADLVQSGGNITISQGIIGKQQEDVGSIPCPEDFSTSVIAAGTLQARYAQHVHLRASHIQLSTQLLHCLAESETDIEVGQGQRNAKLVGGYSIAQQRIAAGVIGAPSSTKTILDFSSPFKNNATDIRECVSQLSEKRSIMQTLEKAQKHLQSATNSPERDDQLKKVNKTCVVVNQSIVSLEIELDKLRKDQRRLKRKINIQVYDRLYPGIEIRLADEIDVVNEEHRAGSFRFEEDRLVFDR